MQDDSSVFQGTLPEGCQLCRQGAKMVLLITGLCRRRCFYCPLSSEKRGRDVVFADEMPVEEMPHIIEEAEAIDALGTGITGGDPLLVLSRTLRVIELLKRHFGDEHHIHLYTGTPASMEQVQSLAQAGLDELRFHPPPGMWTRLGPF